MRPNLCPSPDIKVTKSSSVAHVPLPTPQHKRPIGRHVDARVTNTRNLIYEVQSAYGQVDMVKCT
eukprot:CAMPEP_0181201674 /NCGR_PEP_ID=MMETSP1096-20121128/18432_1 /TAXON_ID=156174 ORGANISM="Chrysochromulina ericina, Strain CCMP281" /NCGR_SAMPLE_ID=MMETSP1096 /ASSEMBLY_ACC=CAM_ASM_000453 /LENGTH=64 /DNA_ID=CAMNT_0023292131 /DNA_START=400 /DNA_END=594 /DNA_ORIENTATION=+